MKVNLNLIFLLLLISSVFIQSARLRRRRRLEGSNPISLTFSKASNLSWDSSGSKWTFEIFYSLGSPAVDTTYTTTILLGEEQSLASCTVVISQKKLNCEVSAANNVLVRLSNIKKDEADITWSDLDGVYNIPITASLNYVDSYALSCATSSPYLCTFKIKITDILPEDGIVIVDLTYSEIEKTTAECTYAPNFYLNCKFNQQIKTGIYVNKISLNKDSGSITWTGLSEDNQIIPIKSKITNYIKKRSTDLELNDNNQWTYKIEAKIARSVYHEGECITINSKIIKTDQTELIYLTRCYALPNSGNNNNYAYYKCISNGG